MKILKIFTFLAILHVKNYWLMSHSEFDPNVRIFDIFLEQFSCKIVESSLAWTVREMRTVSWVWADHGTQMVTSVQSLDCEVVQVLNVQTLWRLFVSEIRFLFTWKWRGWICTFETWKVSIGWYLVSNLRMSMGYNLRYGVQITY